MIASLLVNPLNATINWKNIQDVGLVAGAITASAIGTHIASHYLHHAALERDKIAAHQADKRAKEQKDREEYQRQELLRASKTKAHVELHQIFHNYKAELDALMHKGLVKNREHFHSIIKSKQSRPVSRFIDYRDIIEKDRKRLSELSPLLSTEEKKLQTSLLTQLNEVFYAFNILFIEDAHAENVELKKIKHQEKNAQLKLERSELKNKKLRAEIEAQNAHIETNELIKKMVQEFKKIDPRFAAVDDHINLATATLQEAIATGNAQFAQQIIAFFTKEIDEVKKIVQAALYQAVPQVVVQPIQPPYNPTVVHQNTPSEAIDANEILPPNVPPTYT